MRKALFVAAFGVVGFLAASTLQAVVLVDFESPTYTAGSDIDGIDGWGSSTGVVMPDPFPPGSGYAPPYAPIPEGAQAYVMFGVGLTGRGFGAAGVNVADGSILSVLSGVENLPVTSGVLGGIYLSDNAGLGFTNVPGGIEYWSPTNTFAVYGAGGTTPSAVAFVDDEVYLLEIVMDFTTNSFEGFVTGVSLVLPRTSIGVKTFDGVQNAATVGADGGVVLNSTGATGGYWDDIRITPIPEPASVGLLALSGIMLGRRR